MQPAATDTQDAPLGATFHLAPRKQLPQAVVSGITSHPSYAKDPSAQVNFAWAPKGTYALYEGTHGAYGLAVKTSSHKDEIQKYRLTFEQSGAVSVFPALEAHAYSSNFPSLESLFTRLNELSLLGATFNKYTEQLEQQQNTQAVVQEAFSKLAQEKARITSYGWYSETLSKDVCRSLVDSTDAKPTRPFVFCPSSHSNKAITLVFQGAAYRCKMRKDQWKVTHGAPEHLTFPTLEKLLEHYKLDARYRGLRLS
ncbi:MAG: hypothetical protein LLG04_04480 [Parachlamydia sp.]|nr:hypothetical protein [Parachlamydia sp.]